MIVQICMNDCADLYEQSMQVRLSILFRWTTVDVLFANRTFPQNKNIVFIQMYFPLLLCENVAWIVKMFLLKFYLIAANTS